MTTVDRALRTGLLRDVLCSVRNARRALAEGDVPGAVRLWAQASGSLGFACGIWRETTIAATGTLRKVVARMGIDIEEALTPAPAAEAWELVAEIADGLKVLQARDGVEVTDAQIFERSRNIATGLWGRFRFTHLPETVGKSGALPQ